MERPLTTPVGAAVQWCGRASLFGACRWRENWRVRWKSSLLGTVQMSSTTKTTMCKFQNAGICEYRRRRWNCVFQPVARSHRRAVAWLEGPSHLAPVAGRIAQRVRGLRVDIPGQHGNKSKQNSTFRVRQTFSTQTEEEKKAKRKGTNF